MEPDDRGAAAAGRIVSLREVTGDETLFVLAASPGDESLACGGLIAEACASGRPPLVAVLTDGTRLGPLRAAIAEDVLARRHAEETRHAVSLLGLPTDRLFLLGFYDGTAPSDGRLFDAGVEAIGFLMWSRDCNVLCAPLAEAGCNDRRAARAMARAVAARTGVGLLGFGEAGPERRLVLDTVRFAARKAGAVAAHAALGPQALPAHPETFFRPD